MLLSERLRKIIDYRLPRRGAFAQLEKDTGVTQAAWRHIYNERNQPSADSLLAICKLYPQYTLWLMTEQTNVGAGQTSPDIDQLEELQKAVSGK